MMDIDTMNNASKIGAFVTGATGFIGSNLVVKLLMEDRYKIFCLVRPGESQQERLFDTLTASARTAGIEEDINQKIQSVNAVSGDLTMPYLGLLPENIAAMKEAGIVSVWHCAASLHREEEYKDTIFRHNVDGTRHCVETAKKIGASEFNYFSTAYVAGKKSGVIEETYYDSAYPSENCYEESKRCAEDIVLSQYHEDVFHVRIFRPSIVIGNLTTYESNSDSGFYGFLDALEKYIDWMERNKPNHSSRLSNLMFYRSEGLTVNFMPVDVLVDEAILISRQKKRTPEFHHLTNPFNTSIDNIKDAVNKFYEKYQFSSTSNEEDLSEIDRIFKNKIDFFNPYLMNDKKFERKNKIEYLFDNLDFTHQQLERYTGAYIKRYREKRKNQLEMKSLL